MPIRTLLVLSEHASLVKENSDTCTVAALSHSSLMFTSDMSFVIVDQICIQSGKKVCLVISMQPVYLVSLGSQSKKKCDPPKVGRI